MKDLNIRDLAGEIMLETCAAGAHRSLPGNPDIDCDALHDLQEREFDTFVAIVDLITVLLARHCGERLVNCDEMPVTPLPKRES